MVSVAALFENRDKAQEAIHALREAGVDPSHISVVMKEQPAGREDEDEVEGAERGAEAGAVGGALAGLLAGLGAFLIPGVGPIVAAGPLVGAIAGGLMGAASGGIVGWLIDQGIDEDEAEAYGDGVRRGGVLVSVNTEEENVTRIRDLLMRHTVPIEEHRRRWTENPDFHYADIPRSRETKVVVIEDEKENSQ